MKIEISKHRQPLKRTAIYSLMTLSIAAIVTLLMLVVLGFSFNQQDGKLEQGGLLQFESIPNGATVTLDELKLGSTTNTKSTVLAGNHSASFDRTGYRSWKKSIYINPSQIGWLSYARLIPQSITPSSLRTFTTLTGASASPNRNYMVLHEEADHPAFALADVRGDTVKYEDLTLPVASYTAPAVGKTQSFTVESWSKNEQAMLVRHTFNDNDSEWLLLDRDSPEKSINISATFGVVPSKLEFAGGGDRTLFVQTADVVRRINLDDQTLSRPLATHVDSFTGYDDKTITYTTVADANTQRIVGYASTDVTEPQTLATFPADGQPLFAAMGTYFNSRYVSILYGQQLTIRTGTLPTPTQKSTLKVFAKQTVPAGAIGFEKSRNNRFYVTQLPDGYATYDIELKKYDKTTWAKQPAVQRDLQWLDDYMIWNDSADTLRFYEFDGANQQNIMPVTQGFSADISPNNKFVYGVYKTDNGFEFRRGLLILQ